VAERRAAEDGLARQLQVSSSRMGFALRFGLPVCFGSFGSHATFLCPTFLSFFCGRPTSQLHTGLRKQARALFQCMKFALRAWACHSPADARRPPACSQHSCSAGAAHASLTTKPPRTGAPVGPGRSRRAAALLSARVRTRAGRAGGGCGARRGPARRGAARRGRGGRAAPRPRHGRQRLPAAAGGAPAPSSSESFLNLADPAHANLATCGSGACAAALRPRPKHPPTASQLFRAAPGSPSGPGRRAPGFLGCVGHPCVLARLPRWARGRRSRRAPAHPLLTPNEEGEGSGGYRALG